MTGFQSKRRMAQTFYQPAANEAVEILKSLGYVYEPTYTGLAWVAKKSAQPEQEPTQWRDMVVVSLVREGINKHKARELADHFATPPAAQPEQQAEPFLPEAIRATVTAWKMGYEAAKAEMQPEQEPVAFINPPGPITQYSIPTQRQWVGLTDEEITEIYEMGLGVRASIETALDKIEERNT